MSNEHFSEPRPSGVILDALSDQLREAIEFGDVEGMLEALPHQEQTSETVGLSNRLVAREFMVRQKGELVLLDTALPLDRSFDAEVVEATEKYLDTLREDFMETFVGEDVENKYEKLLSDEQFRKVVKTLSIDKLEAFRNLIEVDSQLLTSPDQVYGWMENLRNDITEELWGILQDAKENGVAAGSVSQLKESIAKHIAKLDENSKKCFSKT